MSNLYKNINCLYILIRDVMKDLSKERDECYEKNNYFIIGGGNVSRRHTMYACFGCRSAFVW